MPTSSDLRGLALIASFSADLVRLGYAPRFLFTPFPVAAFPPGPRLKGPALGLAVLVTAACKRQAEGRNIEVASISNDLRSPKFQRFRHGVGSRLFHHEVHMHVVIGEDDAMVIRAVDQASFD